ncbi:MAG: transporter substrate-binding domain-containing protein [Clostridia bacterium]|nr:transporter substrate-binding domain-containing protein [Clostridia bacterium]
MKKLLALLLALSMVFCFAACGGNEAPEGNDGTEPQQNVNSDLAYIQEKGKLVVGVTIYEPMDYKDENGDWTGFDAEYARLVAQELGVEAEFIVIDWDNKEFEVESKNIDCVWNGMTITDKLKKSMDITDPYVWNAQVVVMNKDEVTKYTTAESIKDLSFAVETGSAGETYAKENGLEYTALQYQSDALLEVKSGKADACIIDITMANSMTGDGTSYADLAKGVVLTEEFYGVGCRKGSDLCTKINEITDELVANGKLTALAEKYELTLAE